MSSTRRQLLQGGAGVCLAALAGCSAPAWLVPGSGQDARFSAPTGRDSDAVQNLLNRATFGVRPGDRDDLLRLASTPEQAIDAWIAQQLSPGSLDDDACEHALARFDSLDQPVGELYEYKERVLLRELTSATVLRAALSHRQLHEVMVHFWTDHFNIDISKGECAWLKVADDREVIRRHALGRFPDLLRASALSPAMLWYLDGRVNRAGAISEHANENYARELLELHTLGVHGGYTQQDVMEAARCLSGWTVRPKSGFLKAHVAFEAQRHDDGAKSVLGQRFAPGGGAHDIELLLALVAAHPATARHIAFKLCRRFIADDPPAAAVDEVASRFSSSNGDIAETLRALLGSASFRADINAPTSMRAGKLKRPFHLLVSCLRSCDASSNASTALTDYLTRMGHAPFQFPTPDGYPEAASAWQGTLLWRWQLASALAGNRIPGTRIDPHLLRVRAGGELELSAHLLGRLPDATEEAALRSGADPLALLLASPAFQRC